MDYYQFCKKIKYTIKSAKFEVKYFSKKFSLTKKISAYITKKRRTRYKKQLNFIKTMDFIEKFGLIEVTKNPFDYGIDLYNVAEQMKFVCFAFSMHIITGILRLMYCQNFL